MTNYFDAHTHVQFAAYDEDRKEVIERALKAGVSFINVGTQRDTSARAVELSHEFSLSADSRRRQGFGGQAHELENKVFATVGLHPIHTEKSYHDEQELGAQISANDTQTNAENKSASIGQDPHKSALGFTSREEIFDYNHYKKLALDPKVVAIGECGLDYYRATSDKGQEAREKQKEAFIRQIELSKEIGKPLMIHCRDAFADLIDILKTHHSSLKTDNPGVIHFFSGTIEDAQKLLDLGFSFTFGGVVTFQPKAGKPAREKLAGAYDEIVKYIPIDRILSETDAPYVAPVPYRGKRNEPLYVIEVVKKLAGIKNVSTEEMAERIFENARRIFKV